MLTLYSVIRSSTVRTVCSPCITTKHKLWVSSWCHYKLSGVYFPKALRSNNQTNHIYTSPLELRTQSPAKQPQKLHFNLIQLILWCLHFMQSYNLTLILGFRMCLVLIRMVFSSNNCINSERGENISMIW